MSKTNQNALRRWRRSRARKLRREADDVARDVANLHEKSFGDQLADYFAELYKVGRRRP